MKRKHIVAITVVLGALILAALFAPVLKRWAISALQTARGRATVASRTVQYGSAARARMMPDFDRAGVSYPPAQIAFLAFKAERKLQVYASSKSGHDYRFIREYPVLGASGKPGPKLLAGDLQVPEGIYRIESLNPNSLYHLSLRVNYPNEFDRAQAARDGRTRLGGDIMIHGKNASIGCLAMGDPAAEDLFVLAADSGYHNITVVLAPVDFRREELPTDAELPPWTPELYEAIHEELRRFEPPA